ncbi:MAG: hypothetical protein H0V69_14250 [Acidimicrobiia bacterium]|nr:hypothetical protein [Acidimicrobiia bacterium]
MKRLIGVLIAATSTLAVAPAASASMDLPTYEFDAPAEDFGVVGPLICDYVWRKGVKGFGDMVAAANGYEYQGPRQCAPGQVATSQHHSGRALDIMIDHRDPEEQLDGRALMVYLFANDAEHLRRLGVVEIIWGGRIWTTAVDSESNVTHRLKSWRVFKECSPGDPPTYCHYDHMHISLSVAGASKRTTFWTARTLSPLP